MFRIRFLFALVFNIIAFTSVSQQFEWAQVQYGHRHFYKDVAIDSKGNVVLVADFFETVILSQGDTLTESTGDWFNRDFFVQKLDSFGNFLWAKPIGGLGKITVYSVELDAEDQIYISGSFNDSMDFDPGISESVLNSKGTEAGFVLKLNAEGGFVFAKSYAGGTIQSNQIALDSDGNIYSAGTFRDSVDFDPGLGVASRIAQVDGLPDFGVFVQKLNPVGDFEWVQIIDNSGFNELYSFKVSQANHLSLSGWFRDTLDLDPNEDVFEVSSFFGNIDFSSFFVTLDPDGTFLHGEVLRSDSGRVLVFDQAIDLEDNLYTLGYFTGTVDFDFGPNEDIYVQNANYHRFFLTKQSPNGAFLWKRILKISISSGQHFLKTDPWGFVYLVSDFSGTCDFDPGENEWIDSAFYSAEGAKDMFILKLDSNGEFVYSKRLSSPVNDFFEAFEIDRKGALYGVGSSYGSINLSPDSITHFVYSDDSFILKWSHDPPQYSHQEPGVFPNPFSESLTIQLDAVYETVNFSIMDSKGALVFENSCTDCSDAHFDLSGFSHGIYFLHIQQNDAQQVIKLLKL